MRRNPTAATLLQYNYSYQYQSTPPTLYAFSNGSRVMDRVRNGETVCGIDVGGCVVVGGGGVDGVVESGTAVSGEGERFLDLITTVRQENQSI